MKNMLLAASAIFAITALAGSASATDFAGGTISYNVGVTSDYVFRGVSQSSTESNLPAIQGGVDYSHGLFYVGAWASNVKWDYSKGTKDLEVDVYGGVKPTYKDFNFDFGLYTYNYGTKELDFSEVKAAVSHPLFKGTIGAAFYDNVTWAESGYYEVNGSYPLTDKLSLSGAVGESALLGSKYSTANLGVTYAISPALSLDVRASDTNVPEAKVYSPYNRPYKPRVAVTLKASF
ncbi:MAG: TorF family putative porin [Asticcacaulis sp.]|uniref:TorF family putative porin n=1 Tax=Asticcacaulis sp. TaxID=1872648 RepID=UPI0039E62B42